MIRERFGEVVRFAVTASERGPTASAPHPSRAVGDWLRARSPAASFGA